MSKMITYISATWDEERGTINWTSSTRFSAPNQRKQSELEKSFYNYFRFWQAVVLANAKHATHTIESKQAISSRERIESVRKVLGINISDLSEILGVARPTIYAFLSGNELVGGADGKFQKMETLSLLCSKIEEASLPIPCNKILRRRNQEAKSLKEILQHGDVTEAELDVFVAVEIGHYQQNRQRIAKTSANKSKEKHLNPESISTPAHLT